MTIFGHPRQGQLTTGPSFVLPAQDSGRTNEINQWLTSLGFTFNPFLALDAATDPYLDRYMVQLNAFNAVLGEWNTFVFDPPGGGKTALRVRTAQFCLQEWNRPFSITYVPPYLWWGHSSPTLEEHVHELTKSGAMQLLLLLMLRPHSFLGLKKADYQTLRTLFDYALPGPLSGYLRDIRETGGLYLLQRRLGSAPVMSSLLDNQDVQVRSDLCDVLEHTPSAKLPQSVADRWQFLLSTLFNIVEVKSIWVLLDGIDAVATTADNPKAAVDVLQPLLDQLPIWNTQGIWLKAFLPDESHDSLRLGYEVILQEAQQTHIEWTDDELVAMLQKRIAYASQGQFLSMDTAASPGLIDVERKLVLESERLPRAVLVLMQRLMSSYIKRCSLSGGHIEEIDIQNALETYSSSFPASV